MMAQPVTRRTALGAGLAALSVASGVPVSAYSQTTESPRHRDAIDAMLIDGRVAMPALVNAVIQVRRQTISVVDIHLDAASHCALQRVLNESRTIIGVSSGATLFCLERIAWDHGFRLNARHQRAACDLDDDACHQSVAAFLNGAHASAASPSPRDYRASRADGILHAWTMRKSARPHFSQDRREA